MTILSEFTMLFRFLRNILAITASRHGMMAYLLLALSGTAVRVTAQNTSGFSSRGEAITLNSRSKSVSTEETADIHHTRQILPEQTAVIICDMWDRHWCKGATERVKEMAPALNDFVSAARKKGMLIVHAPSDCISHYSGTAARERAAKYVDRDAALDRWVYKTGEESGYRWPIDSLTEGCNDSPYCKPGNVWKKQIEAITIKDDDAISDSGSEIAALFRDRGIRNVLIAGVHTNMCVVGRSFGIRSLKRQGFNVALVRDLTDAMYDSRQWPYVSHFKGLGLMIGYIEQYLCPTITSTELTGTRSFRFKEDDRPEKP